ncbi:MAG: hypothetical protein WC906_00945 [Parcubacteria group bacterium]|jgi:capsular polysaccharide biosynthesis protein
MFNFKSGKNNFKKANYQISAFGVIFFALIFSGIAFFLLSNFAGKYRSEISIIFIPKSEKAALDSEHIIENLKILPTKLSFYNKLVRDNGNITDKYAGLSDDKRTKLWNETIKVKREGKSSIIKISAKGNDAKEAETVSKATVSTLLNVASFYYDIKNDADIRIVDALTVKTSSGNLFALAILSLTIGTAISLIISLIFSTIFRYFLRKKTISEISFEKSVFEKKYEPKPEYEIKKKETIIIEKKPEKDEIKKPAVQIPTKKSSAPENLPFIDEDYFRNNIIKGAITEKTKEIKEPVKETPVEASIEASTEKLAEPIDFHREPTKEELKKRLNQLLRGEL